MQPKPAHAYLHGDTSRAIKPLSITGELERRTAIASGSDEEASDAEYRRARRKHSWRRHPQQSQTPSAPLCRRDPNGGHGDRPRRSCSDCDQPGGRDRLLQQHTPDYGIRDEHLRRTFGSLIVTGHILERLPAKSLRCRKSGHRGNCIGCWPDRPARSCS
jgi:hypothetical protein